MRCAISSFALALSTLSCVAALPSGTKTASAGYARRAESVAVGDALSPVIMGNDEISALIKNMAAAAMASALAKSKRSGLDNVVNVDDIFERGFEEDTVLFRRQDSAGCLDSSATDVTINALFHYGGPGTALYLCPGARITTTAPIFFTAPNQLLATQGLPKDETRATILVTASTQATAIYAACDGCNNVTVTSLQVDGQRPSLGRIANGQALIELGGQTSGQIITFVKAWEPRGWSVVHAIEGTENACSNILIQHNEIGPSGNPPNNGQQFLDAPAKRAPVYSPSEWADGISLACKGSNVLDNTLIDTTDGGIVIFGAPGSRVARNKIIARTRTALGGINAVDFKPFSGDYSGTIVEENEIISEGAMIKAGLAIGGMVWGSDNRTASRTHSGTFRNNIFSSGASGYFGYAISVAGHENAIVTGNIAESANFGGTPSSKCIPNFLPPKPQAFVHDPSTCPGGEMQIGSSGANPLVFLICNQPGPLTVTAEILPDDDSEKNMTASANIAKALGVAVGVVLKDIPISSEDLIASGSELPIEGPAAAAALIQRDVPDRTFSARSMRVTPRSGGMVNPFTLLERTQRLK